VLWIIASGDFEGITCAIRVVWFGVSVRGMGPVRS